MCSVRYSLTDWLLAAVVTAGITIFLISGPHRAPGEAGSLGAESEAKRVAPMRLSRSALSAFFPFILSFVEGTGCSTLAGLALLSGFLALDGLTSVMEEKLFKERTERVTMRSPTGMKGLGRITRLPSGTRSCM